jgi:uncharacterized membrane protein
MRIEESRRIVAPRKAIWSFVADPQRYPGFMVGSRWEPIPGEPASGMRARFSIAISVGSIDLGGVVEVIEFEPPHVMAWTSVTGIDHRGRWILRDCGDHTRVTMRLGYQVPGGVLALIASRAGAPMLRADVRKSLAKLDGLIDGDRG